MNKNNHPRVNNHLKVRQDLYLRLVAIKLQAIQRRQPQDVLDAKLLLLQRRLKKRLEGKLLQRKRKKMQRCRCRCQIELSAFFLPHTIVQPIPYDRPAHF